MKTLFLLISLLSGSYLRAQFEFDVTNFPSPDNIPMEYVPIGGFKGNINNDKYLDYFHFYSAQNSDIEKLKFAVAVSLGAKKNTFIQLPVKFISNLESKLYNNVEMENPEKGVFILKFISRIPDFVSADHLPSREITLKFNDAENDFTVLKDGGKNVILPGETLFVENEKIKEKSWSKIELSYIKSTRRAFFKPQKTVVVTSLKEFIAAVDNNTNIELNLSQLDLAFDKIRRFEYQINQNPKLGQENGRLYLQQCYNISIQSQGKNKTEIISSNSNLNTLGFISCSDIEINNVHFKKYENEEACTGSHLQIDNSYNVKLTKSSFTGPLQGGFYSNFTDFLLVENCHFEGVCETPVRFYQVSNSVVAKSIFSKNFVSDAIINAYFSQVAFEENQFKNNSCDFQFISMYNSKVDFNNNVFEKNKETEISDFYTELSSQPQISFDHENNYFEYENYMGENEEAAVAAEYEGEEYEEGEEYYEEEVEAPNYNEEDSEENVIINFIIAENYRDWDKIDQLLSDNMEEYWGEKKPTRAFLYETYETAWQNTQESFNEIVSLLQSSEDAKKWVLTTDFTFIKSDSGKQVTKRSSIAFELDKNLKIMKIYKIK